MVSELHRAEVFEPSFAAHREHENGFARLVLCGELDMATVPFLEQELERAEQTGSQVVALDLEGLTFIDVAGLRGLLAARARRGTDDRSPGFVCAPRAVRRRVFELTGHGDLLDDDLPAMSLNGDRNGSMSLNGDRHG